MQDSNDESAGPGGEVDGEQPTHQEDDRSIETVFSERYEDPKVHHPDPRCPERQRITKRGDCGTREIPAPNRSIAVRRRRRNTGRMVEQWLEPCEGCLFSIGIDNPERP